MGRFWTLQSISGERRQRSRRFVAHGRGQSLVEFALVVPLFLFLIFGILDFGRLFFTHMTVQHAVRQAGRFAVTGRHLPDGQGTPMSRLNSIIQVIQKSTAGVQLDSSDIHINSQAGGADSGGGPGDTVTISVTYHLPIITPMVAVFFPNGRFTSTVNTSFRNEPFPAADAN